MTDVVFTVCKIEAGRAILMSQEDFELIEFPAKLLPKDSKTVTIKVKPSGNTANSSEKDRYVKEVKDCYLVGDRELERFKEEIGSDDFFQLKKLGSTAAIIEWKRSFPEIFGNFIKIDATILNITCTCSNNSSCYCGDQVDFVRRGLRQPIEGKSLRINLPIDLKVNLMVKTSVGYFKSNEIVLKSGKMITDSDDLSGLIIVTDSDDSEELREFKAKGGIVWGSFDPNEPVTAIVTESFDSNLFRIGIDNNIPVVTGNWIKALLSINNSTNNNNLISNNNRLPSFEEHLLKDRKW